MTADSIPGCVCQFGKPTYPNECENCQISEVCEKCTRMNRALRAEFLGKVDEWLKILRGETE